MTFFSSSDFLRDKLKYGDGLTKFTKQSHNLRQYLVIEPLLRHKGQKIRIAWFQEILFLCYIYDPCAERIYFAKCYRLKFNSPVSWCTKHCKPYRGLAFEWYIPFALLCRCCIMIIPFRLLTILSLVKVYYPWSKHPMEVYPFYIKTNFYFVFVTYLYVLTLELFLLNRVSVSLEGLFQRGIWPCDKINNNFRFNTWMSALNDFQPNYTYNVL